MPINACSINAFTINGLGCTSVIPQFPSYSTSKRPVSIPALVTQRRWRDSERQDELVDDTVVENLFIEIAVELFDKQYIYTAENLPYDNEPLIYATGISIVDISPTITIENLQVSRKKYE